MNVRALADYMIARELVREKKDAGQPWPWTTDPILRAWKFTNIRREYDTVTQWIRRWTAPYAQHPLIGIHLAMARYINWPPTLEAIGYMARAWSAHRVRRVLEERRTAGHKVWTGAYMVHGGYAGLGKPNHIVHEVLVPLHRAGVLRWEQYATAEALHEVLVTYNGVGAFFAQEITQDLIYTVGKAHWPDWNTWAVLGPGGARGLNRVMGWRTKQPISHNTARALLLELHQQLPAYLPAHFPLLTVHDVQFNLCEFDKYERVRCGEGTPRSRYHSRRHSVLHLSHR